MPYATAGLLAAVWAVDSYNGFIRPRNWIDESYANAVARGFNTRRQAFSSMIARLGEFRKKANFETAGEQEREAVKVTFDA